MTFKVSLTEDAVEDLSEIYRYIADNDSPKRAEKLLSQLELKILSLDKFAQRGHIPIELKDIGITEYLEILNTPYRIIYTIRQKEVVVMCVLDSRRDLQDLLVKRLLR